MDSAAQKLAEILAKAKQSARSESLAFAMASSEFSAGECRQYLRLAIDFGDSTSCKACAEWLRQSSSLSLTEQAAMLSEVFFLQKPAIFAALAATFPEALAVDEFSDIDMPRSVLAMAVASGDGDAAVAMCLTLGLLPRGVERAGQAIEQAFDLCANPPGAAYIYTENSLCSASTVAAIAAQCERALIATATAESRAARRPSASL